VDLSLFYFSDEGDAQHDRYRLLLEGARFADAHGLAAVWTPERHFHKFGGIFPNPSVTAAAVAAVTSRIKIRAGSVVAPLHHPLRIAEEWSVVDNLSNGRAGLALASGWHPRDFIFRPETYDERRQVAVDTIHTLRHLWRGGSYTGQDAKQDEDYRVFPPPVQEHIPLWLTASDSPQTFEAAGKEGVGVLTHLMRQSVEDLAVKIAGYRSAFAASGQPGRGHVVLMMHTYLDRDADTARRHVHDPLRRYLISSLDLFANKKLRTAGRPPEISEKRAYHVVRPAHERYLHHAALFGSENDVRATVDRVRSADVDEIACLIDFGVPTERALASLPRLAALHESVRNLG
jgi:natural product biosynthesis luciferase-like monooxygenase protein